MRRRDLEKNGGMEWRITLKCIWRKLIGRVWAGFVSGYKPAAGVSGHVNQASSFIRTGMGGGKILCGSA